MADEGQPDPAAEQTTPAPEASVAWDESGNFQEGWIDELVPEDSRHLGVFKGITDVKGAMRQLANLERLRGKQGKGVMPLTEDSTDTEKEAYYKAIGRPDSSDKYEVSIPEELSQYYSDETMAGVKDEFHKAGLTQAQVNAIMQLDAQRVVASIEAANAERARAKDEAEATLKKQWGQAYDERLLIANKVIADNVPEDKRAELTDIIGNSPVVADFLATVGKKYFSEDTLQSSSPRSAKMTPAEANLKMRELIDERASMPPNSSQTAKYTRLSKEINEMAAAALGG